MLFGSYPLSLFAVSPLLLAITKISTSSRGFAASRRLLLLVDLKFYKKDFPTYHPVMTSLSSLASSRIRCGEAMSFLSLRLPLAKSIYTHHLIAFSKAYRHTLLTYKLQPLRDRHLVISRYSCGPQRLVMTPVQHLMTCCYSAFPRVS